MVNRRATLTFIPSGAGDVSTYEVHGDVVGADEQIGAK
jgi:hypothetical protein